MDSSSREADLAAHTAARIGDLAGLERALADGASPDATDFLGRSALNRAARLGHLNLARRLLSAGARLDSADVNLKTAVDVSRSPELRDLLIEHAERTLAPEDLRALQEPSEAGRRAGWIPVTLRRGEAPRAVQPATESVRVAGGSELVDRLFEYTEEDHERFQARGVHVSSRLLSEAGLAMARERVDQVLARAERCGQADRLRMYNLHQCGEAWVLQLAMSTEVQRLAQVHCGGPCEFYLSHVIAKPPHSEYAVPWHQDYRKNAESRPCTIWIALDNMTEQNGAMACLPGWHRGVLAVEDCGSPDFKSVIRPELLPQPLAEHSMSLAVEAGQAVINHPLLPHMSPPNRTGQWRRALLLRFRRQGYVPAGGPADWACDFRNGEAFVRRVYACGETPTT